MKHLSAITTDGLRFGMDVENMDVRQIMKKTFYKDFQIYKENPDLVITKRCVNAADLIPVMEPCAWLGQKAVKSVQLEETGPWLQVIYS